MKPQNLKIHLLHLIIFSLISHTLFSQIITVNQDGTGDFITIQEGINASVDGDTVLVYPGTYFENIVYNGKEITLASLYLTTQDKSYINNTIIDGNQNGSCVRIMSGEDESTVLCGFTIQNGFANESGIYKVGGGIHIKNSNPKILNCIIENNKAHGGGGIACWYSDFFISGTTIRNNYAYGSGGGISLIYNATITFDNILKNNMYLNYSAYGSDIIKSHYCPEMNLVLDTFTVLNPDQHFIYCPDEYGLPVNDISLDILHGKIEPVNHDLYIDPIIGDDLNNGLTEETPLKTISYAYHIIASDSLNPHSIFLSNGIYSPSTNNEKFPLNGRSNISLIGEDMDNTIFDADSLTILFKAYGLMKNFTIKKIIFKNSGENQIVNNSGYGCIFINACKNVILNKMNIHNCIGSLNSCIFSGYNDSIFFENLLISDNKGGNCFSIGNTLNPPKHFYIKNCKVSNNGPDSNPETGEGGGLLISGSFITPDIYCGKIINIEITENLRVPDPYWGPGMTVGLLVNNHAKVDLINATIGDNVLRGVQGYAVNVHEGAELDIYNSIFFGDSLNELSLGSASGSSYPVTANVCYSNIEGGEAGVKKWQTYHTLNWLDGNINEDPLWDTASAFPYSLHQDSPCINMGTPMYKAGMEPPFIISEDDTLYYLVTLNYNDTILLPSTDLAGKPRISGGRIDMGAYEFDTTAGINDLYPQNTDDNKIIVYPNPFYYHTFIAFKLLHGGNVQVIIYDINGKKVKSLMNAKVSKGEFTMTWEGNDDQNQIVKQGTYIAVIMLNGKKAGGVKILKRRKV